MESTADRIEFAPPQGKGSLRAFTLALLVHALLIAALTWGVNWKRSDETASFEAELWSGAAQPAAARPIEAPPPPPPAPAPPPVPAPQPVAAPPAPPPPPVAKAPDFRETPPLPDADIALEREKKRKLLRLQKEADIRQAQKLQEKRDAELQARRDKELAERQAQALAQKAEAKKQAARELAIEKEKEKRTAAAAEKQHQAALEKQKALAASTAAANVEKQKLAAAAAAKQKAAAEAAAASEKQRQAAIQQRIMNMAGAAGSGSSGVGAVKASGPSASYAGKVRAKVLPNVVFTDDISGNPKAIVEVTTTADGTIMSQRLKKPSGNKAWDDAVIKAIIRTGSLPRDVDGTVPTSIELVFTPN